MKISSVVQKNRPTIVGGAEGVSRGVAFGWALSRDNQPLMLQFLLDGKEIGLIQPSIVRNDIAIAASVNHLCGFRFDLKPFLTELNYQKLEIRDKSTGAVLPSTPIVLEPFSGWGVIDGVFGFEAKGWAVSADLSSDSTIVEILIDNEVAGQITTNQYRPDLTKMGIPHIKNGFSFPIPLRWHDGLKHSLTARVQGNASLLRGGGFSFHAK